MKLFNFSIPVIWDAIVSACSRFPLAILSAAGFAAISIFQINSGMEKTEPELQRLMFTLAIGLPWMVFIHLFNEKYSASATLKYIVYGLGILFLILIYFYFAPDFEYSRLQRPVRFFSFLLISHLLVSTVLFFKINNITAFWEYNKNLLISWLTGALYAFIIFTGLSIALLAIDNLFEIELSEKNYFYIWIITVCLYHPIYFLSSFPKLEEPDKQELAFSKVIRVYVYYIFIPLTVLYFLILYAYGFKILLAWNLPKGWVSMLVLGFSGMGIFTYLLNYGMSDIEENKFSNIFKKYFYFILTPLILLLFLAIFRRLSDYGFTPPRYFVLLTGIWLFGICIYFLISKSDNIKWIPLSLMAMLFIGTMSPMDAFKISASSQTSRLISRLKELNVYQDGKLAGTLNKLEEADKSALKEMINVIEETGYLEMVYSILPDSIQKNLVQGPELENTLLEKIGLMAPTEVSDSYEMVYLHSSQTDALEINGFKWMFIFNLSTGNSDENLALSGGVNSKLIISKNLNDSLQLDTLIMEIEEKVNAEGKENALKLPYDVQSTRYQYRFFIKNINYRKSKSELELDYLNAIILCKVKE